jgi:hypothetical protein
VACIDKTRNLLRVVTRKPVRKRLLGRFRCRWTGNTGVEMNFEYKTRGYSLDSSGCVQGPLVGSYVHGNPVHVLQNSENFLTS